MPSNLAKILTIKRATRLAGSFFDFFIEFWDTVSTDRLKLNWHIEFLCNELQEVARWLVEDKPKKYDLVINIPPGTSKSSIKILWLAWVWLNRPDLISGASSDSAGLSIEHSTKLKDVVMSSKFRKTFDAYLIEKYGNTLRIRRDKSNKRNWETTLRGEHIATSTGSSIIGRHTHVWVWDDPQNAQNVLSKAHRESNSIFYFETLGSRVKDKEKTVFVVIMQRLHEDDISKQFLDRNPNARHINLPATLDSSVKPKACKTYYVNNYLDPNRLGKKALENQADKLTAYAFSSQYMQDPKPAGGNMIKSDWFSVIGKNELPQGVDFVVVDGAYTEDTINDPTGIDVFRYVEDKMYWVDSLDLYLELPDLVSFMQKRFKKHTKIIIEPKASGLPLYQTLRRHGYNVEKVGGEFISMSKIERVMAIQGVLGAKGVNMAKADWNKPVLDQITTFPYSKHDEHADTLCYAVEYAVLKTSGDSVFDLSYIDNVNDATAGLEMHTVIGQDTDGVYIIINLWTNENGCIVSLDSKGLGGKMYSRQDFNIYNKAKNTNTKYEQIDPPKKYPAELLKRCRFWTPDNELLKVENVKLGEAIKGIADTMLVCAQVWDKGKKKNT